MSKYGKYISAHEGEIKNTVALSCLNIENDEETAKWEGDKLVDYYFVEKTLKSLTGRILTIVDAALPEGKQNKCVKDLIRAEFIHEFEMLGDIMFDKQRIERALKKAEDKVEFELVDAEDILGA